MHALTARPRPGISYRWTIACTCGFATNVSSTQLDHALTLGATAHDLVIAREVTT